MANYLVEIRTTSYWQQLVEDKDLTTPPGGESKGDRYIIAGINGDWSGGTINDIAQYDGASWDFYTPVEGWMVYVKDEDKIYRFDGSNWIAYKTATIGISIDGGGQEISVGNKGYIEIPYAATITGWTALSDQSGSIKVDIWKASYANYPPTNEDSIVNGHEPEISSAIKAKDTDLSDWSSVSISANDVIGFNVDSCTTIEKLTLILQLTKV